MENIDEEISQRSASRSAAKEDILSSSRTKGGESNTDRSLQPYAPKSTALAEIEESLASDISIPSFTRGEDRKIDTSGL